jgi:N-acetylglucosaminyldiphosphoundecaprenol N-acetyl-beta-D-mannosaminyltransferase
VMEGKRDPQFKLILNSADLFVPDGISLILVARLKGVSLKRRVTGTDLMLEFLERSNEKGYKNFFYGDTDETLGALRAKLTERFPSLQISGTYSPPFHKLTPEEEEREIELINQSGADVLWVALGLPKQERWMYKHRDKLNVPVMVGVGAAFKFSAGTVRRAPSWVGNLGFEWGWRFAQEPKRVWRRVLIDGPRFGFHVVLELTGVRKYD